MTAPDRRHYETARAEADRARDEHARQLPDTPSADRPTKQEQSVGQLLRELSQDTSHLVRQEIQLAQAEMRQKAKLAGFGAGLLAAAAVFGLAMLGAGTALLIIVIALVLPLWLAAFAVTIFYALLTAVLALVGRRQLRKATPATPEQTVETLKEDAEWAKTQARSAKT